jgi:hypothetical protein
VVVTVSLYGTRRPRGYAVRHERNKRVSLTLVLSVIAAVLVSGCVMMYVMWRIVVYALWILALM